MFNMNFKFLLFDVRSWKHIALKYRCHDYIILELGTSILS